MNSGGARTPRQTRPSSENRPTTPGVCTPRPAPIPRLHEASLTRTDTVGGRARSTVVVSHNETQRGTERHRETENGSAEGSDPSELSELSDDAYWEAMIDFDAASRIQALARGWLRRRWQARLTSAMELGKAAAAAPADGGAERGRRLRIGYKVQFAAQ